MASNLAKILTQLQQQAANYSPSDERLRQTLLQSTWNFVSALETPAERLLRTICSEPLNFASAKTLIDLKCFAILSNANVPVRVAHLATATGADPKLLGRLLKHLAAENFVKETAADEFEANDLTRLLASDSGEGSVGLYFRHLTTLQAVPGHLKKIGYVNPFDNHDTAFTHGFETKLNCFQYVFSPGHEGWAKDFHGHMKLKSLEPVWYDDSKIVDAIFKGASDSGDAVLLADVGGNTGTDLVAFKKKRPSLPGRLISQDQLSVIATLDVPSLSTQGVEAIGHDFFTLQPVQHAKAYCLKRVLHDWPIEQCRRILANLKPALKAGYSRILINEIVIPEVGAKPMETATDLLMMELFASQERREGEWRDLVESVGGLEIKKIWDVPGALEKVVEVELA